jgi:hypothetical protein
MLPEKKIFVAPGITSALLTRNRQGSPHFPMLLVSKPSGWGQIFLAASGPSSGPVGMLPCNMELFRLSYFLCLDLLTLELTRDLSQLHLAGFHLAIFN